ncbi:putative G2/M phase checkpoint control protein Sum2 [Aspergillus neoniger CBS 115656]|uniref:G2/M phase checkpoint control protein Sum2 n=1 Tax=Aspergillus neoniger (strain CBS 115656) TaxID=1448310 RepID=A0A318YXP3_ASPNB|nr:hypothetical protein BO87DRAFT_392403 [Aspergillus neoniger CBS 115656]PYH39731.1 hypothetical protein BO87DRAFT_392403 [Aspergillus neoniger CBS 115656]
MDMNHLIGRELTPGSQRFNLISKSDIRYVGTLHEINPEASTIALENVVSFGTEGRRGNPAEEIAPSASVYEYIVFRGSDVKDISVAEDTKENSQPEPQVPDDPAILGSMSRPGPTSQGLPPSQQPQVPRPAPPGYPQQPPFQGFYPPYGQRFGAPGFPPGPGFPNMPYGAPPPGWFPPPGQGFPQGPGQFPPPQMPIGPPGQHQTPPPQRQGVPGAGPVNVPKPTSELPVGDRPSSKPASRNATPAPGVSAQNAPPPPVESKPSVTEAVQASSIPAAAAAPTPAKMPPTGPRSGRVQPAIPINALSKPPVPAVGNPPVAGAGSSVPQGTAQAAITEATRAATAAVAAAMAKLPQPNAPKKPAHGEVSVEGVTRQMAEMKPYEGNRAPRGHHQHPRGRGGHRAPYQGQSKKVEVPDTDYDFETANAKFNKQDLVKEAIATGSPVHEAETASINNGDIEAPDTSADASSVATYNRSTSFFDNISSEARDREEGTGGRVGGREWRGEEEKRNIETFGQGSVDGYRGSYRGRGRGRGYGRGRGGYGRGYSRGRGGLRGGRNTSQATGVPTQT